jgi:hypothetical protein
MAKHTAARHNKTQARVCDVPTTCFRRTMKILERARASGKYPPSLLRDIDNGDDGFEAAILKTIDGNGTSVLRALDICGALWLTAFRSFLLCPVLFLLVATPDLCLSTGPTVADNFKKLLQVGEGCPFSSFMDCLMNVA